MDDDLSVPFITPQEEGSFWRECIRQKERMNTMTNRGVGLDLSWSFNSDLRRGMTHHSQFKCVHIDPELDVDERGGAVRKSGPWVFGLGQAESSWRA